MNDPSLGYELAALLALIVVVVWWALPPSKRQMSDLERRNRINRAGSILSGVANDNLKRRRSETTRKLIEETGWKRGPSHWRGA